MIDADVATIAVMSVSAYLSNLNTLELFSIRPPSRHSNRPFRAMSLPPLDTPCTIKCTAYLEPDERFADLSGGSIKDPGLIGFHEMTNASNQKVCNSYEIFMLHSLIYMNPKWTITKPEGWLYENLRISVWAKEGTACAHASIPEPVS